MSLLETLMGGQHTAAIEQMAAKLGLDPAQVQSAISQLMPALAQGFKQQVGSGNTAGITQALQNPDHAQYVDAPETLASHDTAQGTAIAHQLLGGAAQAAEVTGTVADSTGIHPDKLKALLPMAASLFAGAIAKQAATNGGGLQGLVGMFQNVRAGGSSGLLGSITNLLDANKDGSAVDDILGFFKSKVA